MRVVVLSSIAVCVRARHCFTWNSLHDCQTRHDHAQAVWANGLPSVKLGVVVAPRESWCATSAALPVLLRLRPLFPKAFVFHVEQLSLAAAVGLSIFTTSPFEGRVLSERGVLTMEKSHIRVDEPFESWQSGGSGRAQDVPHEALDSVGRSGTAGRVSSRSVAIMGFA